MQTHNGGELVVVEVGLNGLVSAFRGSHGWELTIIFSGEQWCVRMEAL